jgi:hypothetical protein
MEILRMRHAKGAIDSTGLERMQRGLAREEAMQSSSDPGEAQTGRGEDVSAKGKGGATMRLVMHFLGAAGTVTGSRYRLRSEGGLSLRLDRLGIVLHFHPLIP